MASSATAFARAQLEKYGWKEGKGLGKHEDGISTALKTKLKLNNYGFGYDIGKEFTSDWWNKNFNKIASNIVVKTNEDGVQFEKTKRKSNSKLKATTNSHRKPYGGFVKGTDKQFDIDEQKIECPDIHPKISKKLCRHRNGKLTRLHEQEQKLLNAKQNTASANAL